MESLIKTHCVCAILTVVLGAGLTSVEARIGEGGGKCAERYGSPVQTESIKGGYICQHEKNGFQIKVILLQNSCSLISFKKTNGHFSNDEIFNILDANGLKNAKERPSDDPGVICWETPEKTLLGYFNRNTRTLDIGYAWLFQLIKEGSAQSKKEEARQSTDGF